MWGVSWRAGGKWLASWNGVDRRLTNLTRDCVWRGMVRTGRRAGGCRWQLGLRLLLLIWGTWWSEVERRLWGKRLIHWGPVRYLGSIWVETPSPNV